MYSHDKQQDAPWMAVLFFVLPFLLLLEPNIRADYWWVVVLVALFGLVFAHTFTPLRVRVGGGEIFIKFGFGLFQKKIPLSGVVSAAPARHKLLYGWGIHMVGLKTWVYNISGRKLVKVEINTGQTYYIGTEFPEELASAILSAKG